MPVTLDVRDEGRVLVFTLTDPWALNDLIALGMRSRLHMDRASSAVHRVYDLGGTQAVPPGLTQALNMITFRHFRAGQSVVIGSGEVANRFDADKRFDNEQDALDYLRKLTEDSKGNR